MNIFSFFKKEVHPYDEGFLPVGGGHKIHYMLFGNPRGKAVLSFHGGPGGGASAYHAKRYDLTKCKVLLFSQRGCGLSEYEDLYQDNTPADTVQDARALLKHLKMDKDPLIVSGSSYGATLALLFAIKYKKLVRGLIASSVFLGRRRDLTWTHETARFYPDLYRQMQAHIQPNETLQEGYFRLINSENYQDIKTALGYYGRYERFLGKTNAAFQPLDGVKDKEIKALKVFLHYEKNNLFLKDNEILDNIKPISHIPTLIVHNRLDMVCPVEQADLLAQSMQQCRFVIVPDIGHSSDLLNKRLKKEIALFLQMV